MCMQVKVPNLKAREGHSATEFSLRPGLTEIVIFGGADDIFGESKLSDTTVLRFGESTLVVLVCP